MHNKPNLNEVKRMGKEHKCQICGKIYVCREPDKCDLPFEFGNCSEECQEKDRKLRFYNLILARQKVPTLESE